jgi:hypothetical protein
MRNPSVRKFLVGLVGLGVSLASVSFAQPQQSPDELGLPLRECALLINDFIGRAEAGPDVNAAQLSTLSIQDNPDGKRIQTVVSSHYWIVISVEAREIVAARFTDHAPRQLSMEVDQQGMPISADDFGKRFALVPIDEARISAAAFFRRTRGDSVLETLALQTKQLSDTGNRFVYQFSWTNPPNKDGVFVGLHRYEAWVNAETGAVWSVSVLANPVTETPKMTVGDCRRLAENALAETKRRMLNGSPTIRLNQRVLSNGTSDLLWLVTFFSEGDPPSRPITVTIDDSARKVVDVS